MTVFDPAYQKRREARLSRLSSLLVIGGLSVVSWSGLIIGGLTLSRLF
jgi:hypothetical protein